MGIASTQHLRKQGLVIIAGLGLLLLVMAFLKGNRLTTNPRSRVITVERLVEKGSWAHITPSDTTPFEPSIDMVKIGDRFYSSKPPLYPLVMAGESMLLKSLSGKEFYTQRKDHLRMLVIINQVLPYILMLWSLWLFMLDQTNDRWTLYFMLLALSLGILPFGYAVTINNHTPSAILYVFAFLWWYQIAHLKKEEWWRYALLGLVCGIGFSIELPSGGIGAWFLTMALLRNWKKGGLGILCATLPVGLSLVIYHELSGVWRPFYLQSHLYKFDGSYWKDPEGLDAVRPGKLSYIFHMFFGFRGLFSISPVLILGALGFFRDVLGKRSFYRKEFLGIGLAVMALVVFVIFRTWNYGGVCIGMRWFICFMPLLMLAAMPLVEDMGKRNWGKVVCVLLLVWSSILNIEALYTEAFLPGIFERIWWSGF